MISFIIGFIVGIHMLILSIIVKKLVNNCTKKQNYHDRQLELCVIDNIKNEDERELLLLKSPTGKLPDIKKKKSNKIFTFGEEEIIKSKIIKCANPKCDDLIGEKYFLAFDKRFCSEICKNDEIQKTDPQLWLKNLLGEHINYDEVL